MNIEIPIHVSQKEDKFFRLYISAISSIKSIFSVLVPYIRRTIRFFALPYCYFYLVNWHECTASRWQVIKDFLYIFFKLKYYPDNYSLCRLWDKDKSKWKYYYGSIYDPYQRARLRKEVQKKEYGILFEDKYVCYQLCKAADLPLPIQFGCISPHDDYKSLVKNILAEIFPKNLIIKPVVGKGGGNIYLAAKNNNDFLIYGNRNTLDLNDFKLLFRSVIQEQVDQHNDISLISSSTNTVRVVTLYTSTEEVLIIGAILRTGVGNSFIDNTSQGGIGIGVNIANGTLNKIGYDRMSRTYKSHPTTGFVFDGYKIPFWEQIIMLANDVQKTFFFYKLLCVDVAIKSDGPIIIELNAGHDNVGLEQKTGPILINNRVRAEFKKYNLIINKMKYD